MPADIVTAELIAWCDARVSSDPSVLGGEPVFRGTRLAVRHIGEAIERGEAMATVLEDYPYLTVGDVELARRYARAYTRVP